jgi:hypothetical protein
LHHPLQFLHLHMRILGPVVQTLVGSVFDVRHDLSPGCSIGAQFVSDHPLRCDTLLLQKAGQQPGSLGVTAVLDDFRQAHTRPDRRPAIASVSSRQW